MPNHAAPVCPHVAYLHTPYQAVLCETVRHTRFICQVCLLSCCLLLCAELASTGATFEQLNIKLYDAPVNTQLDEVFKSVMAGDVATTSSSSEDDGLMIEDGSITSSSSSSKEHTVTVSKA